jgi:uncharacterized protein (DUF305 family)
MARTAPKALLRNGEYSDRRFIDMMCAHHQMAIEMGEIAKDKGEHPEIRNLGESIVEDQQEEINRLSRLKENHFGTDKVAREPHDDERSMHGMVSNEELKRSRPFDKAFIRNQIPHHASAIEMASVASMETEIDELREMAVDMIQAQSEEIGNLINWQKAWYGDMKA